MEIEKKHFQFKHPFTALVSGPTGSGKTFLIRRILKNFKILFYNFNNPVLNVLWIYGQWQPLYNVKISDNVIVEYIKNVPNETVFEKYKNCIIVFDDLLNIFSKTKDLENYFIQKSHHLILVCFFIVQNLFHKNIRTISLNSHYIILLKNPRDQLQIETLAKQIFSNNSKVLTDNYKEATREPYGYLVIDLTPDTYIDYALE